jgi:hypothetical protein
MPIHAIPAPGGGTVVVNLDAIVSLYDDPTIGACVVQLNGAPAVYTTLTATQVADLTRPHEETR